MRLQIKNIGKIQDSTIELQGITVIAGANNTGKSTYGKVLYCMFNAFYKAEASIFDERIRSVKSAFTNISLHFRTEFQINRKTIKDILATNAIRKIIKEVMADNEHKPDENIESSMQNEIERIIAVPDEDIKKIIRRHRS